MDEYLNQKNKIFQQKKISPQTTSYPTTKEGRREGRYSITSSFLHAISTDYRMNIS